MPKKTSTALTPSAKASDKTTKTAANPAKNAAANTPANPAANSPVPQSTSPVEAPPPQPAAVAPIPTTSKLKIIIYNGVSDIGGNQIALIPEDSEIPGILLDFGISFGKKSRYFRKVADKLGTPLDLYKEMVIGQLPANNCSPQHLYNPSIMHRTKTLLPHVKKLAPGDTIKNRISSVIFTHAHLDHIGGAPYLHPQIQAFASAPTVELLGVLRNQKRSMFERVMHTEHRHKPRIAESEAGDFILNGQESVYTERKFKAIGIEGITLSHFRIRCIPVDHSITGACALFIEFGKYRIIYTGDLRFEGYLADLSKQFKDKGKEFFTVDHTNILITEATKFHSPPKLKEEIQSAESEEALVAKASELLTSSEYHQKFAFFTANDRDLGRMLSFLRIGIKTGKLAPVDYPKTEEKEDPNNPLPAPPRILGLPPKAYYLLHQLFSGNMPATSNLLFTETGLTAHKSDLEKYFKYFVKIILPRKKSGQFLPEDYAADSSIPPLFGAVKFKHASSRNSENAFDMALFHQKTITPKDVCKHGSQYLIYTSQYELMDLCDFFPHHAIRSQTRKEKKKEKKDGNEGVFIWSQYLAETGTEEGAYFNNVLSESLDRCNIDLVPIHTSGHTDQKALFAMINQIGTGINNFTVIPIHTPTDFTENQNQSEFEKSITVSRNIIYPKSSEIMNFS